MIIRKLTMKVWLPYEELIISKVALRHVVSVINYHSEQNGLGMVWEARIPQMDSDGSVCTDIMDGYAGHIFCC